MLIFLITLFSCCCFAELTFYRTQYEIYQALNLTKHCINVLTLINIGTHLGSGRNTVETFLYGLVGNVIFSII